MTNRVGLKKKQMELRRGDKVSLRLEGRGDVRTVTVSAPPALIHGTWCVWFEEVPGPVPLQRCTPMHKSGWTCRPRKRHAERGVVMEPAAG